jgi:hypothetical protein
MDLSEPRPKCAGGHRHTLVTSAPDSARSARNRSITCVASERLPNQCRFRHSSRKLPFSSRYTSRTRRVRE